MAGGGLSGEITLIGGVLLGLASSLHCVGMCSGICGRSLSLLNPNAGIGRVWGLCGLQVGRLTTYAAIGGLAGLMGASIIPDGTPVAFTVLRWVAAVSLIWIGFVALGLTPRLAVLDHTMDHLSAVVARVVRPLSASTVGGPLALGAIWGLSACPAVYGAAFASTISGSSLDGAIFMIAFGIGTLPGVMGGGVAVHAVGDAGRNLTGGLRVAAGLALAATGFVSIYFPVSTLALICRVP